LRRSEPDYRLMLKRQRDGAAMSDPVLVEAGIQMLADPCPDQPPQTQFAVNRSLPFWKALRKRFKNLLRKK
jgi:hypothetical protein